MNFLAKFKCDPVCTWAAATNTASCSAQLTTAAAEKVWEATRAAGRTSIT